MNKRENAKKAAYFCVILILVLILIVGGLQFLGPTFLQPGEGPVTPSKTITKNGVDYFPRQDITVMLLLGIDTFGTAQEAEAQGENGAADMVMLLIFDEASRECRVLSLDRDTMLEMTVLDSKGYPVGTQVDRLGQAHTYGANLEEGCGNIRKAVSDFLYGIHIDCCVSFNMDAIMVLTDAVGGVKVTVEDDFSRIDPGIPKGECILRGEQAVSFIRSQEGAGETLNLTRVDRQKVYVEGLMEALSAKIGQMDAFALTLYRDISPYIVMDCSANTLIDILGSMARYPVSELVSPEGETVRTEGQREFCVDEEKLEDLILRLFYAPKN